MSEEPQFEEANRWFTVFFDEYRIPLEVTVQPFLHISKVNESSATEGRKWGIIPWVMDLSRF
ncbi:hypothetical protein [Ureibacillus thermosphaericus]|uniref:hypothetical protein n=1 Tax=Ureibacillus thermosphaericus TaxID=51173 RepID=UPI0030C982C0